MKPQKPESDGRPQRPSAPPPHDPEKDLGHSKGLNRAVPHPAGMPAQTEAHEKKVDLEQDASSEPAPPEERLSPNGRKLKTGSSPGNSEESKGQPYRKDTR